MTMSKNEEAVLLERARSGDEKAFEQLVSPLRERIYWRAVKALRDLDDAEDVTQETMVRAFTKLSTFRGDSRFSSWLYMVASNCIRMHLRSVRRKGALPLDDHLHAVETGRTNVMELPARLPDDLAIQSQVFGALDNAVSQLPTQYGSILRLWVEDGLDLKEIHEQSGLSIAAIKSRLHRARRCLRDVIDSEYGEGALLAA